VSSTPESRPAATGHSSGSANGSASGLAYGLSAYLLWGVGPLFWRYLRHVPADEILAHRVVWGLLVFSGILLWQGGLAPVAAILRDRRATATMVLSGLLLAVNWGVFVYAIATERLLHASLGYFINPLVSVVLGMVFLGERLRPAQWAAVALAAAGVAQYAAQTSGLPWISLVLAFSFGFYGLLRKTTSVAPVPGSTFECLLLTPLAIAYVVYLTSTSGGDHFFAGASSDRWLLVATGLVSAAPLVCFTNAAKRLRLSTIGFLQYLAPSCQFAIAVFVWNEPFDPATLRSFVFIWSALVVFSTESYLLARALRRKTASG